MLPDAPQPTPPIWSEPTSEALFRFAYTVGDEDDWSEPSDAEPSDAGNPRRTVPSPAPAAGPACLPF
jgi:hypothetical protein